MDIPDFDPSLVWDEESNRSNEAIAVVAAAAATSAAAAIATRGNGSDGSHSNAAAPAAGAPVAAGNNSSGVSDPKYSTSSITLSQSWRWDPLLLGRGSAPPLLATRGGSNVKLSKSASMGSATATASTVTAANTSSGNATSSRDNGNTTTESSDQSTSQSSSAAQGHQAALDAASSALDAAAASYFRMIGENNNGNSSGSNNNNSSNANSNGTNMMAGHIMHPLAMTSLASCPPYPPPFMMVQTQQGQAQAQAQQQQQQQQHSSLPNLAAGGSAAATGGVGVGGQMLLNASLAGTPGSYPMLAQAQQLPSNLGNNNNSNHNGNNSNAMFNFPSIITNNNTSANPETNIGLAAGNTNNSNAAAAQQQSQQQQQQQQSHQQQQQQQNANFLASHLSELANNFQASNNAFGTNHVPVPLHYGMAVNGFHPQVNAQSNPVLPLGGGGLGGLMGPSSSSGGSAGLFPKPAPRQHPQQQAPPAGGGHNNHNAKSPPNNNALQDADYRAAVATANGNIQRRASAPASAMINRSNLPHPQATAASAAVQRRGSNPTSTANTNANSPTITTSANTTTTTPTQHQRNSRDRNEREQVRAKKITQLITELRVNMQRGGWKEEMKSKYQTLSQCQSYMEYLKRCHKAKEADIEHTKKLVEEQAALLEASKCSVDNDPESVTSSLTDSTARSTSPGMMGLNEESMSSSASSGDSRDDDGSRKDNKKKRKKVTLNEVDMQAQQASNKKSRKSSSRGKKRKAKQEGGEQSSAETSSMSEEDDVLGNESPGGKNISFDKTSSSVSDMTDSNRSSIDANSKGGDGEGRSTSSISSTAAVVRGVGSSQNTGSSGRRRLSSRQRNMPSIKEDPDNNLKDKQKMVVCTTTTKHKKKRRGFHYDYREVFLKSNVPQLIATLSGRIVVWNEFFLIATGLSEKEANRLTIFGIVQSNQLSDLYKMVARSVAEKSIPPKAPIDSTSSSAKSDNANDAEEWQAITLKCIPFPSRNKKNNVSKAAASQGSTSTSTTESTTHHPHPLYITVALMEDENRDQRCFHCILTDCPGTNGKLGSVTPELFDMLFTPSGSSAKKKVGVGASVK